MVSSRPPHLAMPDLASRFAKLLQTSATLPTTHGGVLAGHLPCAPFLQLQYGVLLRSGSALLLRGLA